MQRTPKKEKGKRMAKASINFAKAAKGGLIHNDRSESRVPDYLLPAGFRIGNEVDISAQIAEQKIKDLYSSAKDNYRQKFGQKLQAKSYVWEAVVNLNIEHNLKDVQRLAREIEKETGFTSVQIAIHRDEGHINERGVPQYNLHAHVTFFTLDRETGEQIYRKQVTAKQKERGIQPMNRERLSKLQDLTAEVLGMERGKRGSKAVRMEHKQYKEARRQELAKVKDLTVEIKVLRSRLKDRGAVREDYAKLEELHRQLKEQAREKSLSITEMKLRIFELEKLIASQKEKKDALAEQNEVLKAKIRTLERGTKVESVKDAQIAKLERRIEKMETSDYDELVWTGKDEEIAELGEAVHFFREVIKRASSYMNISVDKFMNIFGKDKGSSAKEIKQIKQKKGFSPS